jgi:hypothetical protein
MARACSGTGRARAAGPKPTAPFARDTCVTRVAATVRGAKGPARWPAPSSGRAERPHEDLDRFVRVRPEEVAGASRRGRVPRRPELARAVIERRHDQPIAPRLTGDRLRAVGRTLRKRGWRRGTDGARSDQCGERGPYAVAHLPPTPVLGVTSRSHDRGRAERSAVASEIPSSIRRVGTPRLCSGRKRHSDPGRRYIGRIGIDARGRDASRERVAQCRPKLAPVTYHPRHEQDYRGDGERQPVEADSTRSLRAGAWLSGQRWSRGGAARDDRLFVQRAVQLVRTGYGLRSQL